MGIRNAVSEGLDGAFGGFVFLGGIGLLAGLFGMTDLRAIVVTACVVGGVGAVVGGAIGAIEGAQSYDR